MWGGTWPKDQKEKRAGPHTQVLLESRAVFLRRNFFLLAKKNTYWSVTSVIFEYSIYFDAKATNHCWRECWWRSGKTTKTLTAIIGHFFRVFSMTLQWVLCHHVLYHLVVVIPLSFVLFGEQDHDPRSSSSPPPFFSPLHKNTYSAILGAPQVVSFYDLLHSPNRNMTFISFTTYLLQSTTTPLMKQQISHLLTLLSFLHTTFHITQNTQ